MSCRTKKLRMLPRKKIKWNIKKDFFLTPCKRKSRGRKKEKGKKREKGRNREKGKEGGREREGKERRDGRARRQGKMKENALRTIMDSPHTKPNSVDI